MSHTATASCLVLALLTLGLAACGGGGTGPFAGPDLVTGPPRVLDGDYHLFTLGRTDDSDPLRVQWGGLNASQGQVVSASVSTNQGGDTEGSEAVSFPYATRLTGDGRFEWTTSELPDTAAFAGGLSAHGELAVVGAVADGADPVVYVLLRRSGSFDAASLTGPHTLTAMGEEPGSGHVYNAAGGMTFDEVGGWERLGGRVVGPDVFSLSPTTGDAAVSAYGDVTLQCEDPELHEHRGGMLEDGSVLVAGGGTLPGGEPELQVYVRMTRDTTAALFAGTYRVVGLERRVGLGTWALYEGTIVADGSGRYTARLIQNLGGIPLAESEGEGTYEVSTVSGLFIDGFDGHRLGGAISPDGSFGVVVAPIEPVTSPNPRIFFLIRS